ncbi:hypothetical protein BCV69DRAFT_126930 [Microstroma glucosiphilum]|uniref:Uncharacterized protein n=1 Tax=Pseudomicrostroma glucosiphilum TaxID=1684307 RepID=A0A316TWL6_9BASI|nr:hypothetical protein BCV69DRAFT_126930 [Pseudomicrostroma glucosiphilum]PWN17876.1 hypothetical protein BCV69DRAFT_126930 [Pseudomicrostroma glucosiphilum]
MRDGGWSPGSTRLGRMPSPMCIVKRESRLQPPQIDIISPPSLPPHIHLWQLPEALKRTKGRFQLTFFKRSRAKLRAVVAVRPCCLRVRLRLSSLCTLCVGVGKEAGGTPRSVLVPLCVCEPEPLSQCHHVRCEVGVWPFGLPRGAVANGRGRLKFIAFHLARATLPLEHPNPTCGSWEIETCRSLTKLGRWPVPRGLNDVFSAYPSGRPREKIGQQWELPESPASSIAKTSNRGES